MKQIFKYLAEHKGAVVMIILLLVVQAYCDLPIFFLPTHRILSMSESNREELSMKQWRRCERRVSTHFASL